MSLTVIRDRIIRNFCSGEGGGVEVLGEGVASLVGGGGVEPSGG